MSQSKDIRSLNHNELLSLHYRLNKQLSESHNLNQYYKHLVDKKDKSLSASKKMIFELKTSDVINQAKTKAIVDQSLAQLYQNKFSQVLDEKKKLEKNHRFKMQMNSALIDQLKIDLGSAQDEVKRLKMMSDPNQSLVKSLHDKIAYLRTQIEKASKADEYEKELSQLKIKLQGVEAEQAVILSDKASLARDLENVQNGLKTSKSDFAELYAKHHSLHDEHAATQSILKGAKSDYAALNSKHNSLYDEHTAAIDDHITDEKQYQKTEDDLRKEIIKSCGQNCLLKMKVRELEVLNDDKEKDISELKTQINDLSVKSTRLQSTHNDKLNLMNEGISDHDEKIQLITVEKQSLESLVEEKKSTIDLLETQLKSAEEELVKLSKSIKAAKEDSATLRDEAYSWEAQYNALNADYDDLLNQTRQQSSTLRFVKAENEEILEKLNNSGDVTLELIESQKACDQLQADNESLTIKLVRLVESISDEAEVSEETNKSLQESIDSRSVLIGENDDLKASVIRLEDAFEILRTHDDHVEKIVETQEAQLDVFRTQVDLARGEVVAIKYELSLKCKTQEETINDLRSSLKEKTEKSAALLSLNEEHVSLKDAVDVASREKTIQMDKFMSAHVLLKSDMQVLAEKLAKKGEECVALKDSVNCLTADLVTKTEECVKADGRLDLIRKANDGLVEISEARQTTLEEFQEKHLTESSRMTNVINNYEKAYVIEEKAHDVTGRELGTLKAQFESLQNTLAASEDLSASRLMYLDDLKSEYQKFIASNNSAISGLKNEFADANEKSSKSIAELNKTHAAEMNDAVEELRKVQFELSLTSGFKENLNEMTSNLLEAQKTSDSRAQALKLSYEAELQEVRGNNVVNLQEAQKDSELRLENMKLDVDSQLEVLKIKCEELTLNLREGQANNETERVALKLKHSDALKELSKELSNTHEVTLKSELKELSDDHEDTLKSERMRSTIYRESSETLANELENVRRQVKSLQDDGKTLTSQLENAQGTVKSLKEDGGAKDLSVTKLQDDLSEVNKKLEFYYDMETCYHNLQDENAENKDSISNMETRLMDLVEQSNKVKTQLAEYDTPSGAKKTCMTTVLGDLATKVEAVPSFDSPENDEWEMIQSDNEDFEKVNPDAEESPDQDAELESST